MRYSNLPSRHNIILYIIYEIWNIIVITYYSYILYNTIDEDCGYYTWYCILTLNMVITTNFIIYAIKLIELLLINCNLIENNNYKLNISPTELLHLLVAIWTFFCYFGISKECKDNYQKNNLKLFLSLNFAMILSVSYICCICMYICSRSLSSVDDAVDYYL